ncbi:hypothetical protein LCGC14_1335560, partial [marine sediment metagenome]
MFGGLDNECKKKLEKGNIFKLEFLHKNSPHKPKMNKKSKSILSVSLIVFFVLIFSVYLIVSAVTDLTSGTTGILEGFGIAGIEVSEIKIESTSHGEIKIEPGKVEVVGSTELDYDKINIFESKTNLNHDSIKQLINLSDLSEVGFSGTLTFTQTILIDYNKVRWNGTEYLLTTTPVIFGSWNDTETGDLIVPNIFMDDKYNKRINYKDIAEKGGYATAFEGGGANSGKYFVELIIENISAISLQDFFVDPGYVNQTDGFSISSAGANDAHGLTFDSTDNSFWVSDSIDDFIYHFNSAGVNQSDGFSVSSAIADTLLGLTFDSTDNSFWASDITYDFIYHFNSAGVNQSDGFSISSSGANDVRGLAFDSRDNSFWAPDTGDGFVYHFNSAGVNQSDGFNTSLAGSTYPTGLAFDSRDNSFWLIDAPDSFIYHFNSAGVNQSDGFSVSSAGIGAGAASGLTFDSTDNSFWALDTTDDFIYHFADTTNPSITSLLESPSDPATYTYTQNYQFNATVTDSYLQAIKLEFDGTNYTASNIGGDIYNITRKNLAAGTYNYRWYANDTSGNSNNTETGSYTINKANPSSNMAISGTTPIEYPTTSDFSPSETNTGDGGCSYSMDKSNKVYGVTTWTFNYSTSGCTNYSAGSVTKNLVVNINSSLVLGISGTTPITYGTSTNVAGSDCPSQLSCSLDIPNKVYGVGVSPVTFNYSSSGNTNYSAVSITKAITINKATPTGSVSGTSPITYGTAGNVEGTESNSGDGGVTYQLFRNDILVSNPDTTVLTAGNYNYIYNTTGGENYTASASLDTFSLTVDKDVPSGSLTTSTSWTIESGTEVIVGLSESNSVDGDVTYIVYRDGVSKGTGETWTPAVGSYNYLLNTTGGTNWTANASMDTETLTVQDTIKPIISIAYPANTTYA